MEANGGEDDPLFSGNVSWKGWYRDKDSLKYKRDLFLIIPDPEISVFHFNFSQRSVSSIKLQLLEFSADPFILPNK